MKNIPTWLTRYAIVNVNWPQREPTPSRPKRWYCARGRVGWKISPHGLRDTPLLMSTVHRDTFKNNFNWNWLVEKDKNGMFLSEWVRKLDGPGVALCNICNSILKYGSAGKSAFLRHVEQQRPQREGISNKKQYHRNSTCSCHKTFWNNYYSGRCCGDETNALHCQGKVVEREWKPVNMRRSRHWKDDLQCWQQISQGRKTAKGKGRVIEFKPVRFQSLKNRKLKLIVYIVV